MTPTSAPETVTLSAGFIVSLEALQLAWSLETRGFSVRLADDGGLVISPRSKITAADDLTIRQHRAELIAIVCYTGTI